MNTDATTKKSSAAERVPDNIRVPSLLDASTSETESSALDSLAQVILDGMGITYEQDSEGRTVAKINGEIVAGYAKQGEEPKGIKTGVSDSETMPEPGLGQSLIKMLIEQKDSNDTTLQKVIEELQRWEIENAKLRKRLEQEEAKNKRNREHLSAYNRKLLAAMAKIDEQCRKLHEKDARIRDLERTKSA